MLWYRSLGDDNWVGCRLGSRASTTAGRDVLELMPAEVATLSVGIIDIVWSSDARNANVCSSSRE